MAGPALFSNLSIRQVAVVELSQSKAQMGTVSVAVAEHYPDGGVRGFPDRHRIQAFLQ